MKNISVFLSAIKNRITSGCRGRIVDYHFPKDLQSVNVVLKLGVGARGDTVRYLLKKIYLKVLIVPQKPRTSGSILNLIISQMRSGEEIFIYKPRMTNELF